MTAIGGHLRAPAGNCSRYGVENQTVVTYHAQAQVAYTIGATNYLDTITAPQAATVWNSSPTTSVIDMTLNPLVTFIVPQKGVAGNPTLYVAPERLWGNISAFTDAIPLDYITFDRIQRYQLTTGIQVPTSSESWQGGATSGVPSAQSWQGGATTSSTTSLYYPMGGGAPATTVGFWLKVGLIPGSTTSLIDLYGAGNGYLRLALTSGAHILVEWSIGGATSSTDISLTSPASPILINTWYWITASLPLRPGGAVISTWGQIYQAGGATNGSLYGTSYTVGGTGGFSVNVGIGTVLSGSGYQAFPNATGYEMSKFQMRHGTGIGDAPPSADTTGTGYDVLYMARQTLGAAAQLDDSSGNGVNAAAGAQGLTILNDGPYAA